MSGYRCKGCGGQVKVENSTYAAPVTMRTYRCKGCGDRFRTEERLTDARGLRQTRTDLEEYSKTELLREIGLRMKG